mgnify:CR=1 FL=1
MAADRVGLAEAGGERVPGLSGGGDPEDRVHAPAGVAQGAAGPVADVEHDPERVEVRAERRSDDTVLLTVEDSGPGIAPEVGVTDA